MPRTEREKISDGSANAWIDIRLTFGRLVNVSISLTCMYLARVKNIWRPCKHAVHDKVSCSRSEELFSQTPNEVRDWISSWSIKEPLQASFASNRIQAGEDDCESSAQLVRYRRRATPLVVWDYHFLFYVRLAVVLLSLSLFDRALRRIWSIW